MMKSPPWLWAVSLINQAMPFLSISQCPHTDKTCCDLEQKAAALQPCQDAAAALPLTQCSQDCKSPPGCLMLFCCWWLLQIHKQILFAGVSSRAPQTSLNIMYFLLPEENLDLHDLYVLFLSLFGQGIIDP